MAKRDRGAQMVVEMDADAARLWKDLQKTQQKVRELEGGVAKAGRTAKRTKGFMEQAFDPKRLTQYVTGMVSVSAAGAGIVKMLRDAEEQAEASATHIRSMVVELKELHQISMGKPELAAEHQMLAKRITAITGAPEIEALRLVQRGLSLGLPEQDLLDLSRAKFFEEAPAEIVERVGDIRRIFGRQLSEVESRAVVNMALQAQAEAKVGAAQMMGLATGPAQLAKALGATPEQAIALAGAATVGVETPEVGITQAKAFLKALYVEKRGRFLGGEDLEKDIERFRAMPEVERKRIVGERQEALMFMERVMDPEQWAAMRRMFGEVKEAGAAPRGEGLFGRLVRGAAEDPRLAGLIAEAKAKERLVVAEEPRGVREMLQDAAIAEVKTTYAHLSLQHPARWWRSFNLWLADIFQQSPEDIIRRGWAQAPAADAPKFEAMLQDLPKIAEELKKQTELTRQLLDETRGQGIVGLNPNPDQ